MDNLPIILVVVGVAAVLVYFLFFRKKTEAPAAKLDQAKPSAQLKTKKDDGAPPPRRGTPLAPESLPSQDVLAADESDEIPAVMEAPALPGGASKKDVAGLRKGLAATRGGFMARLKAIFVG